MIIIYKKNLRGDSYLSIGVKTEASVEVSCCSLYSISASSAENNSLLVSTSKRVHSFKLYARLP